MLYYLCRLEDIWGPLRLFRYITFRSTMALITALLWLFIVGPRIFAWLGKKNCKDVVRSSKEIHNIAQMHSGKASIPTMGGLAVLSGVLVACLLWLRFNCYGIGTLCVGLLLAITGIMDDWTKIKHRHSRGIKSHWKWLIQGLATWFVLYFLLKTPGVGTKIDGLYVPCLKTPLIHSLPAIFLFLYWFIVLSGTSNALNLTDGIDGLAIGCSITITLTYAIFAYITGHSQLSAYLHLPYLPGVEELCVLCAAIAGACIGFLWFNAHPATIFMGDTGSLPLGAWIGCVALMTQQSITLIIVGFVFVLEALSVILQVLSFKLYRKRIFKMSPLHHHFELMHIPESKIIVRFWIVSLLCALLGLMTLKLR
ncbi:MAG: phospho-N-acetylmuramoyl-pentapeptide-transferase [Puniceicoccales bacterium]|nr:phospho-N-acetylmuramoyl-pentapeptide-transferase [Puniceicoccales bacterium]